MKKRGSRFLAVLLSVLMLLSVSGFAEAAQEVVQQVKLHYVLKWMDQALEYTGIGTYDEDGCAQFHFSTKGLSEDLANLFVQVSGQSVVFGSEETGLTQIDGAALGEALGILMVKRAYNLSTEQATALHAYITGEEAQADMAAASEIGAAELNRLSGIASEMGLVKNSEAGDLFIKASYDELRRMFAEYLSRLSGDNAQLNAICALYIWNYAGAEGQCTPELLAETLSQGALELNNLPMDGVTGGIDISIYAAGTMSADITYGMNSEALEIHMNFSGDLLTLNAAASDDSGAFALNASTDGATTAKMDASYQGEDNDFTLNAHCTPARLALTLDWNRGEYGGRTLANVDAQFRQGEYHINFSNILDTEDTRLSADYANGIFTANLARGEHGRTAYSHRLFVAGDTAVYNGNWNTSAGSGSLSATVTKQGETLYAEANYFEPVNRRSFAYGPTFTLSAAYDTQKQALSFNGNASQNGSYVPFEGAIDENGLALDLWSDGIKFMITLKPYAQSGLLALDGGIDLLMEGAQEPVNGLNFRLALQNTGYGLPTHNFSFTLMNFSSMDASAEASVRYEITSVFDGKNWRFDYADAETEGIHLTGTIDGDGENFRIELNGDVFSEALQASADLRMAASEDGKTQTGALEVEYQYGVEAASFRMPFSITATENGSRMEYAFETTVNGETANIGSLLVEAETTYVAPPAHVTGEPLPVEMLMNALEMLSEAGAY